MKRKVDLHIHTCASDGSWSPEEVVKNIDLNDIKIFAVSDHDAVASVARISELVDEREDLTYIKAVEISVIHHKREYHILTYNIDETNPVFMKLLEENQAIREDYNEKTIAYVGLKHKHISIQGYKNYKYNPYQGGWKAYSYLFDTKTIQGIHDYFDITDGFDYPKNFHSPEVVLPILNKLGYTTILAHPPAYTKGDLLDIKELDYWRELGIQGLECYSQYLKDFDNSKYYTDYCHKHKLVITGGSDCHGGFVGRKLCYPLVTEDMITLICHCS